MRFSVLASGSGGNACFVETAYSRILIDAGLSCKELIGRLNLIKIDPESLDALVITHEHMDHIKGAGPLARRLDIPVYINSRTLTRAIRSLGNLPMPVPIHTGQTITLKDLSIETFTKCHDAVDPIGVVISSEGVRLGLVTDLGRSTRLVEDRLKGCYGLIAEFNHDQRMLEDGPYPLDVKRRIRGPEGHLSNTQAGELLKAVAHEDLGCLVLAHLSQINNEPQKALREARNMLARCGLRKTRVLISHQDHPAEMVEF
jgi:phosphoribosyl 1,2-cyclic phosphodiesterase